MEGLKKELAAAKKEGKENAEVLKHQNNFMETQIVHWRQKCARVEGQLEEEKVQGAQRQKETEEKALRNQELLEEQLKKILIEEQRKSENLEQSLNKEKEKVEDLEKSLDKEKEKVENLRNSLELEKAQGTELQKALDQEKKETERIIELLEEERMDAKVDKLQLDAYKDELQNRDKMRAMSSRDMNFEAMKALRKENETLKVTIKQQSDLLAQTNGQMKLENRGSSEHSIRILQNKDLKRKDEENAALNIELALKIDEIKQLKSLINPTECKYEI